MNQQYFVIADFFLLLKHLINYPINLFHNSSANIEKPRLVARGNKIFIIFVNFKIRKIMTEYTFREVIAQAMSEEMRKDESIFLMGEEVAEYNGAYKASKGMLDEFGPNRYADCRIGLHRNFSRCSDEREPAHRGIYDF